MRDGCDELTTPKNPQSDRKYDHVDNLDFSPETRVLQPLPAEKGL